MCINRERKIYIVCIQCIHMTEVNLSARVPRVLEEELEEYMKVEHLEKSAAIRKILFGALAEWKVERAIKLLEEGKTTVSRGAEIAKMDIWTFVEKLKERKVRWVKENVVVKDIERF